MRFGCEAENPTTHSLFSPPIIYNEFNEANTADKEIKILVLQKKIWTIPDVAFMIPEKIW